MSEKEKKRRKLYRKNREKLILFQSMLIIVLAVAIVVCSIVSIQLKMKYYVHYTERGSIDYNVFLKDNEFYAESHLGQGQSYVASLIDRIITNFNYRIDMDTEDVNYRYSYKITSTLEILDDLSNVAIFNPEEVLVNVQNKTQSSSDRLEINEIVVIDYDEYNNLASKFLETYDLLGDTTSHIIVKLEVDVLSDCDAFSGSAVDTYISELRIPLTTKTVNIKMTSSVPDEEARMIACTRGVGSEVFATTAIVLGVIEALFIAVLASFVYLTRTPDITYATRVKKIVSQYKSYIQRINNMFETTGYQVIYVNTFDEMLEIRDTIQAPILMHENEDQTCCKFIIPTDSKLLYVYLISVEGYQDPPPAKVEEPAHTTIVKPNITNVVRPVVKVVVNPAPAPAPAPEPDPVIHTVLEEPEVEADETVEVIAMAEEVIEPEEVVEIVEIEAAEEIEEIAEIEVAEEIEEIDETEVAEEVEEVVETEVAEEVEEVVETEAAEEVEEIVETEAAEEVEEIVETEAAEEVEEIVETEAAEEVVEIEAAEEVEEIVETEEIEIAEVVEEQDSETEELLSSIPQVDEAEAPEEEGVEAIDVFWKERPGKTYRYDPNGYKVENGDVVLVPSRDEASRRDIVREAEVARGNYRIDPDTLDRPLKKIIGVVRRKAEEIFVAMITPTEEELNDETK